MVLDEIKRRLAALQNQINSLTTLLPRDAQVNFNTVDFTQPEDIGERKRLVITVTSLDHMAVAKTMQRIKPK